VDKACSNYLAEAFSWYDNSAAGIELALETGLAERTRNADFLEWRERTLERQLSQLSIYAERLEQIRHAVEEL
jgi:hypothetical protein